MSVEEVSMRADDPRPPRIDGYEYREPLARGGHSVVLRYHQLREQRDVAVKVLTLHGAQRGASAQVVAEANKMARLSLHPNIVPVFFSAEDGDRPYIVMAFCPGRDLWTLLREHGPFDARRVLRVGVQIAGALQAAHSHGIVHRDLKPANILTDEYGAPRLTDFGISALEGDAADGIAVSVPWAPPEVLAGRPGDVAADVYSLGATLWNLLAGRMPFDRPGANSPEQMEARIRAGRAPRTGRAGVPPALEDLLQRMMAPVPAQRPATAAAVAAELERIEEACGGPVRADDPWHAGPVAVATPRYGEELLTRTRVRHRPPEPEEPEIVSAGTQRRKPDGTRAPIAELEPPAPAPRRNRWVWGAAAAGVAAAAVLATVLAQRGGQAGGPADRPSAAAENAGGQDAGAGGDLVPPGVPTVTGERVDAQHVRFTWTYSAPYDSDTFLWRTGADNGTAPEASVSLAGSGEVCLEVKVIRADGRNGSVDWSPKACVR
ncbi:serine/threonine-protein kinase [Dactylosporangium sp. CA-139066]|uniref:serine/threonine-protein kinase n=1 Tax=Dactylosporangium sp. CA-139066 TaxID=3239930 RepID=UPI003D8BADDD